MTKNTLKKIFVFALLLFCSMIVAAQIGKRETNLRSLVAAEREFSRISAEKGTRDAFLSFLADGGVIFNPFPNNGKKIWSAREKAPGILTWTPVFADVSDAGDLGFTTGPYEFRRAAGENPVGHGYYMSVWRKGADGVWKVLLDIGTRNAAPEATPNFGIAQISVKKRKKIDLEQERIALVAADEKLSRLLAEEKTPIKITDFAGDYLRFHQSDKFPLVKKNDALAAFAMYQGKINSQTIALGIAQSGDFGYSYGTFSSKTVNASGNSNLGENGSFARIWRKGNDGKWKFIVVVMHALPQTKNAAQ